MTPLKPVLGAAAATLLLVACSGGSSGPDMSESQMQREDREASATIAGLIGFAKAQIATFTSDTAQPRAIGAINPPTSETAEPAPL
jgi:hypothetical protein